MVIHFPSGVTQFAHPNVVVMDVVEIIVVAGVIVVVGVVFDVGVV